MNQRQQTLFISESLSLKMVRSLLLILMGLYGTLCLYGYFCSDSQIFLPPPATYQDSAQILKLKTANKLEISAIHLINPEAVYTLLYSHGNAEDLGQLLPFLNTLKGIGFSVLAFDYQGYGTSQGKPTVQGSYQDIQAAYRYLTQEIGLAAHQIIAYGRSVGSGPAVDLAARDPLAGLILESPFVSAFRVLTQIRLLPFDRFENSAKIGKVQCPLLIIHGTADSVIPLWHGQHLFRQANQPKYALWVEGADHNDVVGTAGDLYSQALQNFADSVSVSGSGSEPASASS